MSLNETRIIGDSSSPKIIVLAGAGASVQLSLPTLDDLLRRAILGEDDIAERIRNTRNSIEAAPSRYRAAVFEELIGQIRDYIKISRVLRTDHTFRRFISGTPYDIDNGMCESNWKKALIRCYQVLLDEYGPGRIRPDSEAFLTTLDLFAELAALNDGELHIFTTNYDCSYQVLASNCDTLKFLSHIDNSDIVNVGGVFREGWWYSTQPELTEKQIPSVYIHRLHGCVAWFAVDQQTGQMLPSGRVVEQYGAGKAGGKLEVLDDVLPRMCIKLIASQLVGTNPVFASAFEEFGYFLKESDTLLVWGYSFRDLEVLRQMNHALAVRRTPLQIYYLDPYLTEFAVLENIRATFQSIPIQVCREFRPGKIEWDPSQGCGRMIQSVVDAISEKGKKERMRESRIKGK